LVEGDVGAVEDGLAQRGEPSECGVLYDVLGET